MLLNFKYVFAVRFVLFDFISCQCRCFLTVDMWILTKFFFFSFNFLKKRDDVWTCVCWCIFHVLFFDNLLWDSRNVNSYQFSLNWNDNLSCNFERNVCLQFSIHVCMHIRMLKYDEMFVACSWHIYSCSHVQILTRYNHIFRSFRFVCMLKYDFWRDVLTNDSYFAICNTFMINVNFEMFFIKMFNQRLFVSTFFFL